MPISLIHASAIDPKHDRGGEMRVLLSPKTVESRSGFMGTMHLVPGDFYANHLHPFSDEYLYVVQGEISITDDCATTSVHANTAVFIPKNVPHRLQNTGDTTAFLAFFSTPLAPSPELGHVTLEEHVR